METLFEHQGVQYEMQSDYKLPCVTFPNDNNFEIGVWGERHRRYLKEHHKVRYCNLLTADNLPKGKVPMLERWGYMFIQQSRRNDGMLFLCALMGNKIRSVYKMRTIKQFISKTNKVYFFMKDKDTCNRFYQAAETEGISFCGTPPTQKETTDIIALLPSGEICYVGWAGRMCCHNCKKGVVRIDYDKYSSGYGHYLMK